MHQPLPSLNALRAFETAARHLSFKKAAEELHVTPGAISHQIKGLEDYLGVQLFHRLNQNLSLTEAGRRALPGLQEGFAHLAGAVEQLRQPHNANLLRLWAPPSLSAKWLVPRLHRFAARYPDIDLRMIASSHLIDPGGTPNGILDALDRQEIELIIWFGQGNHPDWRVDKLFSTAVVPLCSPSLLQGRHPLRQPQDLIHHRLIHDDTAYSGRPDWSVWLKTAGISGLNPRRGLHFNHISLALDAACGGQGVVLSLKLLAQDDLNAGRLVIPFDLSLSIPHAYYLITPPDPTSSATVGTFRDWLLAESSAAA